MKTYTIDAATERQKEATEAIIGRIKLAEKLQIRHKRAGNSCPLEVAYIIKDTPEKANVQMHFSGCLSIEIDDSEPEILANGCSNVYVLSGKLATLIFENVLVIINFAKPDGSI